MFENTEFSTKDNGIFNEMKYQCLCANFNGELISRTETIFVRNETVGYTLLERWNAEGNRLGFPKYQYRRIHE